MGNPAGALSAVTDVTHTDIISLYVLPSLRGKGYGRELVEVFSGIVKDTGFLTVSCEYPEDDSLNGFFSSMGFDLFASKEYYITTLGEVLRSPMYKKLSRAKSSNKISVISDMSPMERRVFDNHVLNGDYDPEWSSARMSEGKYKSCMLVKHGDSGINIIWTDSVERSPDDFRQHTKVLVKKALSEYPDRTDIPVKMTFERKDVRDYVAKIFGGREHLRKDGRYINALKII